MKTCIYTIVPLSVFTFWHLMITGTSKYWIAQVGTIAYKFEMAYSPPASFIMMDSVCDCRDSFVLWPYIFQFFLLVCSLWNVMYLHFCLWVDIIPHVWSDHYCTCLPLIYAILFLFIVVLLNMHVDVYNPMCMDKNNILIKVCIPLSS